MEQLFNMIKAVSGGLDGLIGHIRIGLVSSFDPVTYSAKVMIQPENVLSGWLPVMSSWVGNGWGMITPILPGTQVVVLAQEGNAEQGIIAGALWSSVDRPPSVEAGEACIFHKSGSFIRLLNDGEIEINAKVTKINGDLIVDGDISDLGGKFGTINKFRNTYNEHNHLVSDVITSKPLEIV